MGRSWHRRNREHDLHLGPAQAAFETALEAHLARMTPEAIHSAEKATKRLLNARRKQRGRDRAMLRKMLASVR